MIRHEAPLVREVFLGNPDRLPHVEDAKDRRIIRAEAAAALAMATAYKTLRRDSLTRLGNGLALEDAFEELITNSEVNAALLYIDLKNFKRVNDGDGHQKGDDYLKTFGQRLAEFDLRNKEGLYPREEVFHLHGDEYVVLIHTNYKENGNRDPNLTPQGYVEGVMNRIRGVAASIADDNGLSYVEKYGVTANIGAAFYEPGDSLEAMKARADMAMYADKLAMGDGDR